MSNLDRKELRQIEILFLFPNFQETDFSNITFNYHLGVGYILAFLKEKGIAATQFIYKEPIDIDTLTEKILQQKPKIVGFTCYDTNYYFIKLISQLLKKKNPSLTIIVGGPTATFSDKLIMQDNLAIDICVRGEAEYTTYELLKRLKTSPDISDIQGISYRSKGKLIQTPDRPLIKGEKKGQELDILPSPYLNNIFPAGENCGILTSRGCVFKCIYCNFSALSRWTIRYHSVESVIAELKTIHQRVQSEDDKKGRFVEIWDDLFSLNIERARQICRRIIEEKINLPLWVETRADRVDKELLNLMHQAGFQGIGFGLESASTKVLHTIKKIREHSVSENNLRPEKRFIEKVRKNVKSAKKIGLKPTVSMIVGLPGATIKDDRKTIEFVRQLDIETYYHNYLFIFSGTELFKTYRRYGLGLKQPLTLLPYQTEYAYDVYKIPEMENSFQSFVKRNHIEMTMKIMTGEYGNLQGDGYPDLLLSNASLDGKTIKWIRRSIAISPVIGFVNGYSENNLFQQNINRMIYSGLPAVNFYLLASLDNKDINLSGLGFKSGRYKVTLAAEVLSSKPKNFLESDFLECMSFTDCGHNCSASLDMEKQDIAKVIFTLSTFNDIENLLGLASYSDNVVLKGDIAKLDCYFLDECRWSDTDCPAVRFQRAIVDNDSSIIPCFNGKRIAKVGDERKDIIKNLRLLWNDMKKRRSCYNCSVRDNCSKCLFPHPMSSKEYCQMRRKMYPAMVGVNRIFKLLKIVRKIRSFNSDLRLKPKLDKIVGVFNNGLVVVNMGKKRYLYHHRFDKLYES